MWGLVAVTFMAVVGCDEGMNMVGPVVTEPVEEPAEPTEPTTNGEVKQPEPEPTKPVEPTEPQKPTEPEPKPIEPTKPEEPEPEPEPQPTVTINVAAQQDDGSVTVSGTSTDVPAGTTVTVTLGDTVTATTTTDNAGAWTVTVTAAEAENLTAGTVAVTVVVAEVSATGSYEHIVPVKYGIPVPTKADEIVLDIVVAVFGEVPYLEHKYNSIQSNYGNLFDVETESGKDIFQRLVEYNYGMSQIANNPPPTFDERLKLLDQYYTEAFGISLDFAFNILKIYIGENPDQEYLLGGWDADSVGIAWLLVQQANPDATEEEMLEHFRQASRDGTITITSLLKM